MQYNQQAKLQRNVAAWIKLAEVYSYFDNWSYLYCTNNIKKGAFQNIINKGLSLQFLLDSSSQELVLIIGLRKHNHIFFVNSSTKLGSWRIDEFDEALLIDWSPWNLKLGFICIQIHYLKDGNKVFRYFFFRKFVNKLTTWRTWRSSSDWVIAIKHETGPNLHSIRQDTLSKRQK